MTHPVRINGFRRLDAGKLLGTAEVDIGPVVLIGARLVSTPDGLLAVGPVKRDGDALLRTVVFRDRDLQQQVTKLMEAEYHRRPAPGEREAPCRHCSTAIRWERGRPYDARSLDPHHCRGG